MSLIGKAVFRLTSVLNGNGVDVLWAENCEWLTVLGMVVLTKHPRLQVYVGVALCSQRPVYGPETRQCSLPV